LRSRRSEASDARADRFIVEAFQEKLMSTATTHVTLDPTGTLRTLVLQEMGQPDVSLTVRGQAPERLRYLGQIWAATHARLHRPMASDGYGYVPGV
jgi:hypothetical protein